jgi:hypothetical protein
MRVRVAGPYRGIVSRSGRAQGAAEASIGRGLDPGPLRLSLNNAPRRLKSWGFTFTTYNHKNFRPEVAKRSFFLRSPPETKRPQLKKSR